MPQDLKDKLKTYIVSKKVQIMALTNDRLSYCLTKQINPKDDLRIMQLGLEIKILREVQKVTGITDDEIMDRIKENTKDGV